MDVDQVIASTIEKFGSYNWLKDFPWLTGYLGDPKAPIWFVAGYPSRAAVEEVDLEESNKSPNLQWSYKRPECRLFRDAIKEAGLKLGPVDINEGWHCYITNVVKEPLYPSEIGKDNKQNWKNYAEKWLCVMQHQIDTGSPRVLVAVGRYAERSLNYMRELGLRCPDILWIPSYAYVMQRPEGNLGPGDPERQKNFIRRFREIADGYLR